MKTRIISLCIALICLFGLTSPAPAAVSVTDAWTRATAGGTSCAVYFNVTSTIADRLTGARSPIAAGAVLHLHKMSNGVMMMRPLDGIDLAADKPISFAPLGYHIMLTGLKTPLKPGDHFLLTLIFVEAGTVTADILVKPLRDPHVPTVAPAMDAMPGMGDMGGMK